MCTLNALLGVRHWQCILLLFALAVSFMQRINLSLAIVAMTSKNNTNPDFPKYQWNMKTRSNVLSSFSWGYVITQIPGGSLAYHFGGKVTLLWSIFICSLLDILMPISAEVGDWPLVCAIRVAQGLCQGMLFPAIHTVLSKWAPVEERNILSVLVYSGAQVGTVATLGTSGLIASSFLGWPGIFYTSGSAGLLWCIVSMLWSADTPNDYKSISVAEKQLIEASLGAASSNADAFTKRKTKTPWLKFFSSPPFLALTLVHSTQNWGYWTLLTQIPSYIHGVHDKDITSNALLSALPYLVMLVMCFFFSGIAVLLKRHPCLTLGTSRKLFNTISDWSASLALLLLGYTDAEQTSLAIVMLSVTVGMTAAAYLGFHVNHIDLSPNFAGFLMGITNCMANVMGILAPLAVGLIVVDEHDAAQWRLIFILSSITYFVGNLLFIIFGSAEVQPWNEPNIDESQTRVLTSEK